MAKLHFLGATILSAPGPEMTHLLLGTDPLGSPELPVPIFNAKPVIKAWIDQCWVCVDSWSHFLATDSRSSGVAPSLRRASFPTFRFKILLYLSLGSNRLVRPICVAIAEAHSPFLLQLSDSAFRE